MILPATAFAEKTGTFTNTDWLVQLGRQPIEPAGEAKPDLWIIQQLGWTGTMATCRNCSTRCGTACPASPASAGAGSMTRRSAVLDALEPDPVALVHLLDRAGLGGKSGDVITIASRRGAVVLYARADEGTPRGAVFVPFCYYEAAINRLTNRRWTRLRRSRSSSTARSSSASAAR